MTIVGVCNCSMFCCALLYVHSSFAFILMGEKRAGCLLSLSTWCLVIVVWLLLVVPWVCLHFAIVVFADHTHLLFSLRKYFENRQWKFNSQMIPAGHPPVQLSSRPNATYQVVLTKSPVLSY